MKRSTADETEAGHLLLRAPEEAVHDLTEEGAKRVDDDPELSPGHDACAVCAGPLDRPVSCAACESVRYCSPQHLMDDAPSHATVCTALRLMRQADQLIANAQDAAAGANAAWAASGKGAAPALSGSMQCTSDGFRPPGRLHHGWRSVVPEKFVSVLSAAEAREQEGGPLGKRPHKLGDSGDAPAASGIGAGAGAGPDVSAAAPLPSASLGRSDTHLLLAADLAERTSFLSYAYTAAHALQSLPAARAAAGWVEGESRQLQLFVLGAAADAELGDLKSWQITAAALGRDVRITFVGPEVPDELAGTETQMGRVAMRFCQCTYDPDTEGSPFPRDSGGPDIYFAFNPGFTCPDYEWSETVKALARGSGLSSSGRSSLAAPARPCPCLVVATNTRMEAQMEAEWLGERGWRAHDPASRNPYTSLKLIQSGTLANDLYRKNAWLVAYEYRGAQPRETRAGRFGRRGAKAAAKRAAKALFTAMLMPVTRLLRKR